MKRNYFFIFIFFLVCLLIIGHEHSKKEESMVIGFTGDVMLGRLVNEILKEKNPAYPWGNVLPLLHKNDYNIINLETAITSHHEAVPKVFNFKTDPKNVASLKQANISIVSIANNHILDFGEIGLFETLATLQKNDIAFVGAGKNIGEAQKPHIFTHKGITIGVIAFTDNEPSWLATDEKPGINYINVGDIETIKKIIEPVKNSVDFLIASCHWGPNMREKPTQEFINFAHQMIDAGIDIIHGHSAHIFQGIEFYKQKLIMYDTGDFVDDYAVDPELRNDISFLFQVKLSKNNIQELTLIPVYINTMQVNLAKDKNYSWAINRMQKLSEPFGTKILSDGTVKIKG